MKFGLLVIGPAGSGKSTFCYYLQQHMQIVRRPCRLVNLDPAAEYFAYTPDIDIRDLVTVQDVAEELELGPNGALVCAMEFLQQRLDWLEEQIADYDEDELFVLDCPGQIELYTHLPLMAEICSSMQLWGLRLGACCCLDVSFMTDAAKLLGGSLMALSAMVQLELPHINLLTKCDLVDKNVSLAVRQSRVKARGSRLERLSGQVSGDDDSDGENEKEGFCRNFGLSTAPWRLPDESLDERDATIDLLLSRDPQELVQQLDECMPERYKLLNAAFASLLEDYSLVSYLPCNVFDEDSLAVVTAAIDHSLQYGEDLEVRDTDPVLQSAEGE